MDFRDKYLKYKNKYINLKNKIEQTGGITPAQLAAARARLSQGRSTIPSSGGPASSGPGYSEPTFSGPSSGGPASTGTVGDNFNIHRNYLTIRNNGSMNGFTNSCMWISLYHYLTIYAGHNVNLEYIRLIGNMVGEENKNQEFDSSIRSHILGLERISEIYNIRINIYNANRDGNLQGISDIFPHPSRRDFRPTHNVYIASFGRHFELIIQSDQLNLNLQVPDNVDVGGDDLIFDDTSSTYVNHTELLKQLQKLLDEKERYSDCKIGKQVIIFGLQNQTLNNKGGTIVDFAPKKLRCRVEIEGKQYDIKKENIQYLDSDIDRITRIDSEIDRLYSEIKRADDIIDRNLRSDQSLKDELLKKLELLQKEMGEVTSTKKLLNEEGVDQSQEVYVLLESRESYLIKEINRIKINLKF